MECISYRFFIFRAGWAGYGAGWVMTIPDLLIRLGSGCGLLGRILSFCGRSHHWAMEAMKTGSVRRGTAVNSDFGFRFKCRKNVEMVDFRSRRPDVPEMSKKCPKINFFLHQENIPKMS